MLFRSDELTTNTLLYGLGIDTIRGPAAPRLTKENTPSAPRAIARAAIAVDDVNLPFRAHREMLSEAETAYRKLRPKLAPRELEKLGRVALHYSQVRFVFDLSVEGLALGESRQAYYLFLRSQSLMRVNYTRSIVILAAALHLARERRDEETIDLVLGTEAHTPRLTPENVLRVAREERKSKTFPGSGSRQPDYSDLAPRAPFSFMDFDGDDDDDDDDDFDALFGDAGPGSPFGDFEMPEGLPPEIAKILLEAFKEGARRGDSPEEVMQKLLGGGGPRPPGRKNSGRRNR